MILLLCSHEPNFDPLKWTYYYQLAKRYSKPSDWLPDKLSRVGQYIPEKRLHGYGEWPTIALFNHNSNHIHAEPIVESSPSLSLHYKLA